MLLQLDVHHKLTSHQIECRMLYSTVRVSVPPSANLSTGPPRPPMPAGRVSWLLLVSVSRKSDNKVKRDPVGVSALLSMAAKLRVVAGRDLRERSKGNKINGKYSYMSARVLDGKINFALKLWFALKLVVWLARQPVVQVEKLAKLVRVAHLCSDESLLSF